MARMVSPFWADRVTRVVATALLGAAALSLGCAGSSTAERGPDALEATSANYPDGPITIIAPANPGGGWDQTARQIQQVLTEVGVLGVPVEVVNRGGAGGTIGLSDLVTRHRNNPHTLMIFGQVMLGAIRTNNSPVSIVDTVPLARLLNEYEVVAVPADAPYQTFEELIDDFRRNPEDISWAGGSAGGIDHVLVGLLALAAGIDPSRVNYIAHAGGGEAAVAVMGSHVSAGVSGFGEWKSYVSTGRMRLLAVSAAERIDGDDTPTIREGGLDVAIANWRGIVAPPGIDDEARDWLVAALSRMRDSEAWQEILRTNEWEDSFLTGDALDRFLTEERATADEVLRSIGLTR
jgi:putative tricarboxylic transport membrane protein